jgi:hypothetical protein
MEFLALRYVGGGKEHDARILGAEGHGLGSHVDIGHDVPMRGEAHLRLTRRPGSHIKDRRIVRRYLAVNSPEVA